MNRILYLIIAILLFLLLLSVKETADDAQPSVYGTHKLIGSDGKRYDVVVIDSCEYVKAYRRLTHKGNCVYCAERNKKNNIK